MLFAEINPRTVASLPLKISRKSILQQGIDLFCPGHDALLEAERRVRHQLLLGQERVGEATASQNAKGFGREAGEPW